jgi:hypothetical protein
MPMHWYKNMKLIGDALRDSYPFRRGLPLSLQHRALRPPVNRISASL